MVRFPDVTAAFPGALSPSFVRDAARRFDLRFAIAALCIFFLALAGLRQMDAACRKAIVTHGQYSLVETSARHWPAPGLRVGWEKKEAYIGFSDYAILEALAAGSRALSILALLTPAAWFALFLVNQRAQPHDQTTGEENDARTFEAQEGMCPATER